MDRARYGARSRSPMPRRPADRITEVVEREPNVANEDQVKFSFFVRLTFAFQPRRPHHRTGRRRLQTPVRRHNRETAQTKRASSNGSRSNRRYRTRTKSFACSSRSHNNAQSARRSALGGMEAATSSSDITHA